MNSSTFLILFAFYFSFDVAKVELEEFKEI